MSRFQQGSLFKLKRKTVPDVWVFRWYENSSEKRTYKKQIIGNVTKLRNRREAEKNVIALRSSINAEVGTPKTVCDLAAHYRLHELTRERKAFSTIDNHRLLFKRYIEPRWGHLRLGAVRTVEVEEWLHSLPLAPSLESKAEVCHGRALQPCDPPRMVDVQSNQPSKDIAEAAPGQGRAYTRRISRVGATTLRARPGHGFAHWQHWSSSIRNDRPYLVRPQPENDGGERAEILCTEPYR